MAFEIELDEDTAGNREVPFRVFLSNGTAPDTAFSTATVLISKNAGAQAVSTNSSSVISANAGMYAIQLTAGEVDTLGSIAVFVDAQAADFPQHVAQVQVVNTNLMSSQSNIPLVATVTAVTNQVTADATAISGDATAADNLEAMFDGSGFAATASSIGTVDNLDNSSVGTVSHLDRLSVDTVNNLANDAIRALSFTASAIDATAIAANAIGSSELASGAITAATFAAGAIDAAAAADDFGHEMADQLINRSIAGSADTDQRNVGSVYRAIRNRVAVDESVLTVFQEDDTTSAWTASTTTGTDPSNIVEINPR